MKREISKPKLAFTTFAIGITCYALHKLLGNWPLAVFVSSFIVIVAFRPIPNAKNCPGWFWHKCNQKEVSGGELDAAN